MHIKLSSLAVASAATLVLAGCGGGDGGGESSGNLAGEGSGDSCVIEDPVPVSAALSLTGAAASYGESQQKGLELAKEELDQKEGVTYDLTVEDDQTDPRQGITLFEQFAGDGASIIIGPTLSNTAFQAQPIAQEEGVPVRVVALEDLERELGTTGGHIHHGEMALDQLYAMRPIPSCAQYRTPIEGLYLCGAGTHPGGGITGHSGVNAARTFLRDRRRSTG